MLCVIVDGGKAIDIAAEEEKVVIEDVGISPPTVVVIIVYDPGTL